jgi:hypothetical protein
MPEYLSNPETRYKNARIYVDPETQATRMRGCPTLRQATRKPDELSDPEASDKYA